MTPWRPLFGSRSQREAGSSPRAACWRPRWCFSCGTSALGASDTRSTTRRNRRWRCLYSKNPVETKQTNKKKLSVFCGDTFIYITGLHLRCFTMMPYLWRMPTRVARAAGGTHRGSPQEAVIAGLHMSHKGRQRASPTPAVTVQARQGQHQKP